jgi:tetratricopeptide (TPR) repeat protein
MAKKKTPSVAPPKAVPALPSLFPWDFRIKSYILIIIGFVFYANSSLNQYALDDSIAIEQNDYVKQGISGIGKIMTTDAYDCFYRHQGADPKAQYSGGRYRPLCYVTFAIEQSLFGDSPFIRHLVNILCYMACIFVIFYFLSEFLLKKTPGGGDMAFLSALLFAIHPLHTEVVANIKSLDEILSLTLIISTFIFSLKYLASKKKKDLVIGLACFLLSLFAKEYAITLVVLLPLLFYLVGGKDPGKALAASFPYYIPVIIYLAVRNHAVGLPHAVSLKANDPLVDPLLYATNIEKLATKCYALGRDLKMLLCPYPLACDYSYSEITYKHFSDLSALLPPLIFVAITIWAIIEFRKKTVIAFLLLFFLACIALISNFLVELGGLLGERFLFHPSFAFLTIASYYGLNYLKKVAFQTRKNIVYAGTGVLMLASVAIVWPRNAQWKNDDSLFIHDVFVVPYNCLLNNDAGWCYLGLSESPANKPEQARAYLDSAKKYLYRGIAINKNYVAGFANLATAYFHLAIPDSARLYINKVRAIDRNYPLKKICGLTAGLYLNSAMYYGGQKQPYKGIEELKKGIDVQPDNADLWYNLGGAYYTLNLFDSARKAWSTTLQIKPDYVDAQRGLQALPQQKTQ